MFSKDKVKKLSAGIVFKIITVLYIILGFGFVIEGNPLGLFANWWLLFIGIIMILINTLITIIHFKRMSIHFILDCALSILLIVLLYFLY